MLQHVAKVLQLLREKPKFLALLAVPAAGDPPMADFGGSLEQRRAFADALPAAFLEEVMATATDTTLGTQRRAGALEAVRQIALLAAAADATEPAALTGTALSRSVSAEVIASIAMAAGPDMILRQASMAALRAAAGAEAEVYGESMLARVHSHATCAVKERSGQGNAACGSRRAGQRGCGSRGRTARRIPINQGSPRGRRRWLVPRLPCLAPGA